ncbi:hypothetical protein [Flavobacterium sp. HNIBRBA15423]|uniref:hypothetical protein n=1 Tax=Flavobacterium sp. HNIBRBA15423 TaxID=3458683 RepID=UPI00404406FF
MKSRNKEDSNIKSEFNDSINFIRDELKEEKTAEIIAKKDTLSFLELLLSYQANSSTLPKKIVNDLFFINPFSFEKFDYSISNMIYYKNETYLIIYQIYGYNCKMEYSFVYDFNQNIKNGNTIMIGETCDSDSETDTIGVYNYQIDKNIITINHEKYISGEKISNSFDKYKFDKDGVILLTPSSPRTPKSSK